MAPYLPSLILLVVGLLLLILFVVRLSGVLRRLRHVRAASQAVFADRTGLLRARTAALRVAIGERRGDQAVRSGLDSERVPSGKKVTTGGRP